MLNNISAGETGTDDLGQNPTLSQRRKRKADTSGKE
jgi:hypothetical protein